MGKGDHNHKWMPPLYATYFGFLQLIAARYGYALAIHGSLARDLDLIAVPWIEDVGDPLAMLAEMKARVGVNVEGEVNPYDSIGQKPHGRTAYTISTGGGGYLDISIMEAKPPIAKPKLRCPKIAVEVTPGTTIASNRKPGALIAKRKGTTSQYYGVTKIKSTGKWHARIVRKGVRKTFGTFKIEEKAALAVQEFMGNAAECERIRAIIAEKYPPEQNAVDVRHKKEAADGLAAIGGAFTWKWACKGCGETTDQRPDHGCLKCGGYSFEDIKVLNDPDVEISRAVGRHH